MHVERLGGHWRGALELALGREHALREPVARIKSALYAEDGSDRRSDTDYESASDSDYASDGVVGSNGRLRI